MLTLREGHLAAFREITLAPLRRKVVRALRETVADWTADRTDGQLDALVAATLDRCERSGLTSEYDIFVLSAARVIYGTDLGEPTSTQTWAAELLRDPEIPGDRKAQLLSLRIFLDHQVQV